MMSEKVQVPFSKQFTKVFMLKLVFCYLGFALFFEIFAFHGAVFFPFCRLSSQSQKVSQHFFCCNFEYKWNEKFVFNIDSYFYIKISNNSN